MKDCLTCGNICASYNQMAAKCSLLDIFLGLEAIGKYRNLLTMWETQYLFKVNIKIKCVATIYHW